MNTALSHISHYTPAVFAVRDRYQILLPVHTACTFWVRVGEEEFYDDSNGILRSATDVHCVTVPMEALDRTGCYTVLWQIVEDRKPYFSVLKDAEEQTFAFRPLPGDGIRIYQIADAHGHGDLAAGAAEFYLREKGGLDLLILNGDIVDHSGCAENFLIYYELAAALTKGEIPITVSRGNHDLRGVAAEKLEDYMPSDNGKSYFSFRLGSLWGIVLDCAEDKDDANPEYGNTNRCHAFRLRENEAFRQIVSHAGDEYAADGVRYRMVLSHVPFQHIEEPPFDIEQPLYREWVDRLNVEVKPDLMLCGHIHEAFVCLPGDAYNHFPIRFPVVVGSKPMFGEKRYIGCGVLLQGNEAEIIFNDAESVVQRMRIPLTTNR